MKIFETRLFCNCDLIVCVCMVGGSFVVLSFQPILSFEVRRNYVSVCTQVVHFCPLRALAHFCYRGEQTQFVVSALVSGCFLFADTQRCKVVVRVFQDKQWPTNEISFPPNEPGCGSCLDSAV